MATPTNNLPTSVFVPNTEVRLYRSVHAAISVYEDYDAYLASVSSPFKLTFTEWLELKP